METFDSLYISFDTLYSQITYYANRYYNNINKY